jgi:hypothetical protein
MPRFTKAQARANESLAARLNALLVSVGAAPNDTFLSGMYELQLTTKVGRLVLNVHANDAQSGAWIAGRFEDVDRAHAALRDTLYAPNPYSGKWNLHFWGADIEAATREVRFWLGLVGLKLPPQEDEHG